MDKALKRKIRRLWRDRALLGVGALILSGGAIWQLQNTIRYRPQQPVWTLELAESVEILTNASSSAEDKMSAQSTFQNISKEQGIQVSESLFQIQELTQALTQELARNIYTDDDVYSYTYDLAWSNARHIARDLTLAIAQAQAQDRASTEELQVAWDQTNKLIRTLDQIQVQAVILHNSSRSGEHVATEEDLYKAETLAEAREIVKPRTGTPEQVLADARVLTQSLKGALSEVLSLNSLIKVTVKNLETSYGVELQHGQELQNLLESEPARARSFGQSQVWLLVSILLLSSSLFALTKIKSGLSVSSTAHLVAFLPEECAAELGALQRRMQKAKASPWKIRLRLLEEFLTLLWVFYIQVQLENLTLPSGDREIDD